MFFMFEINDFKSEIIDFNKCKIIDFLTRCTLISMFEIVAFLSQKSVILVLESMI